MPDEPAASPRSTPVEAGNCPIDLAYLKDDLGISGTTDDQWLQRRIDSIWARFEAYCFRPLQPPMVYEDDWGQIATNLNPWWRQPATLPPSQLYLPMVARPLGYATVFLRNFPVTSLVQATLNSADYDVSKILYDSTNGKLIAVQGPGTATDLSNYLLSSRAKIRYVAGFNPIPADIYEALLGIMQVQWQWRQALKSGMAVGGFLPTRINTLDVGGVELNLAPNFIAAEASKAGKVADPLLGIYSTVLDPYVDYRNVTGGMAYPTTTLIGPPP
jgi:hypothetical protein